MKKNVTHRCLLLIKRILEIVCQKTCAHKNAREAQYADVVYTKKRVSRDKSIFLVHSQINQFTQGTNNERMVLSMKV